MSLISFYFFLLYFLISFSLSNSDSFKKKIHNICSEFNNTNTNNNTSNFNQAVKYNFEYFICKLFREIYQGNNKCDNIFDFENEDLCYKEINKSFSNIESKFYYDFLSLSGSSINKIGDEKKCIKSKNNNYTYYLIEMNSSFTDIENELNNNSKIINVHSQYVQLNGFLENNKFYLGFCVWENCSNFFNKFFKKEENECLFEYLWKYKYTAEYWYFKNNKEQKNKLDKDPKFVLAVSFILLAVTARIILRISYYCTEKNQSKEPKYFRVNPSAPTPEEILLVEQNLINNEENQPEIINNIKEIENINNINEKKILGEEISRKSSNNSENMNQFLSDSDTRFSKLSSIMTKRKTQAELFLEYYEFITFDNLYELETKSFNSKNLLEVCGLKFFLLLFISFYYVYTTFHKVKWNSPGTLSFYQDTIHILLAKLSKMSFRIWIFFDGFEWCYKLLSYIKKLKSKRVTFKHLLIFNINIVEKILVFIIIFMIFIYQFENIGNLLLTTSFKLHKKKYLKVECYKHPLYILILPILGYKEKIGEFKNCFNFVYILVNELYSIIICTFLFFIFFKFRKKTFEYLFLFLFFVSIFFSYFYFREKIDSKNYYLRFVLGEDLSLKYIGLFFQYFFIGCISGLVYYYSTLMNLDLEKYNVFENCYKFMYCFINMSHVLRHFLGFLCLFLIMLICCYYRFLVKFVIQDKFKLITKIGPFTRLVISYENIAQIFLFMIFFFDIILSSEIFTKIFLSNDIFIIFERCSFIFLIICEQVVFLFETLIYLDGIYWNTENILYLSTICFLINFFISSIMTFFIQLPIRFYTKKKQREILENYEKNYKFKFL